MDVPATHDPNPLDLMFFVADEAARGLGLPNLNIQIMLELGGRIDTDRLRRAVGALLRRHPAAGGRLATSPLTGRPRWRLVEPTQRDLLRIVRVHAVDEAGRITPAAHREPPDSTGTPQSGSPPHGGSTPQRSGTPQRGGTPHWGGTGVSPVAGPAGGGWPPGLEGRERDGSEGPKPPSLQGGTGVSPVAGPAEGGWPPTTTAGPYGARPADTHGGDRAAAALFGVIERLYNESITDPHLPPVRVHVLRAPGRGDVLMVRTRHALMDARGATFFLEDLDELYSRDAPDPAPPTVAGGTDADYARLAAAAPPRPWLRETLAALVGGQSAAPPAATLADPSVPLHRAGRLRIVLRRLDAEQTRAVRDGALRTCGFGRFGDYLRACALRALARGLPRPLHPDTPLTTLNLVNHRKRRARSPVCRNLTSAIPLAAPAQMLDDLVATADHLRDQMLEQLAADYSARQFATLARLMRLPIAPAAAAVRRSWNAAGRGGGLFRPPSLPLGLMGAFTRPMETFCGLRLRNYYGLATARPRPGYTIDANLTERGMNLCGAYYEGLVPAERIPRLLDEMVRLLLTGGPT